MVGGQAPTPEPSGANARAGLDADDRLRRAKEIEAASAAFEIQREACLIACSRAIELDPGLAKAYQERASWLLGGEPWATTPKR